MKAPLKSSILLRRLFLLLNIFLKSLVKVYERDLGYI